MGKFHEKLDASGDPHMVEKSWVEVWLSEFVLEYSNAGSFYDKIRVVKRWFK